jgi:hypothetical protein
VSRLKRGVGVDRTLTVRAAKLIAGIGTMHMIKKGQMICHTSLAVSAADCFYTVASR